MPPDAPERIQRQAELADLRWVALRTIREHYRAAYPGACTCGACRAATRWVRLDEVAPDPTTIEQELARLGALLHRLAGIVGATPAFGAIEEEGILQAARALSARAGTAPRLPEVLELIRRAHSTVLMGSAPRAKADLGEAARLLAATIDGRA